MRISDWSSDVCSSDLGIDELGEAHDPAERLLDRLVVGDGGAQGGAVQAGQAAGVALAESLGPGGRRIEIVDESGRVGAGIEVDQVPAGQFAESIVDDGFGCHKGTC